MKIALIGLGKWGINWFRALAKIGVAPCVFDNQPTGKEPEARTAQLPEILNAATLGGVRGVVLATPAETHFPLAKRILKAGLHLLVEKPLALRSRDARELIQIARKSKSVLMAGHLLDYHPGILKMRSLIRAGIIGKIRYITSNRLNLGTVRKRENVLWSFAPHDISVILRILGSLPVAVRCHGAAFTQKKIADISLMQMRFSGGVQAFIYVSWFHPFKEQRFVVVGSKGMLSFCDLKKELIYYPSKIRWKKGEPRIRRSREVKVPFSRVPPLELEARSFLEAIKSGKAGPADGQAGMEVLQVLEAGEMSMRKQGREIRLSGRVKSPQTRRARIHVRP